MSVLSNAILALVTARLGRLEGLLKPRSLLSESTVTDISLGRDSCVAVGLNLPKFTDQSNYNGTLQTPSRILQHK
jgi:hypothetical protein